MNFHRIRFGSSRLMLGLLLVLAANTSLLAANVTLTWNPPSGSGVLSYKVYQGTASHSYSTSVNVGTQTNYTAQGLNSGTYYFAITAVYSGGESSYSNEVSTQITSSPPSSGSLAHSGTMIGNSQNFALDHPVSHLWDGCTDATPACTTGNANITSFWVDFDLGKNYALTSSRLFGDADGAWASTSWQLEYRQNPTDAWGTAFTGVNAFASAWSTQALAVTARYIRVTVSGSSLGTQARELEVFGTPVSGGTSSPLPAPTNVSVK